MSETHTRAHVAAATTSDSLPFRVDVHSGRHRFVADEPESNGGQNAGPNPVVLWLSGLASCTAITLRMYSERKGWDLGGITVEVDYVEDEGEEAHVSRTIGFGKALDDEQRGRLAEIAEKTPVTKIVKRGTPIQTTLA